MPASRIIVLCLLVMAMLGTGCRKNKSDAPASPYVLSYGDSIFYIRNQATDYIINPTEVRSGRYFGFPEGIEIEESNGAIDVSKCETGLRYKISFVATGTTDTISTLILISGINYYDKIYNLSNNDTLAVPIYNASQSRSIPDNSLFDDGGGCKGAGVTVDTANAVINLAQTIRNGVFGGTPNNGSQVEVELFYRVNDASSKAKNGLRVKLYYFNTAADITPDLIQLINDRKGTLLGASPQRGWGIEYLSGTAGSGGGLGIAKPRPPCIFIVGR